MVIVSPILSTLCFSAGNVLISCCQFNLQCFKEMYWCAVQLPVISSMKPREHIILFRYETRCFSGTRLAVSDSDCILNRICAMKGQTTVPIPPAVCMMTEGLYGMSLRYSDLVLFLCTRLWRPWDLLNSGLHLELLVAVCEREPVEAL